MIPVMNILTWLKVEPLQIDEINEAHKLFIPFK
jgi:hypothetical protein